MKKVFCDCGSKGNVQNCDCEIIHHDIVENMKRQLLDAEILSQMSKFYKAIADNTRLRIIDILQKHEMCVCDISVLLNMTKSAVSHQLSFLKKFNIVKCRRSGKIIYYSLADDHVKKIFDMCLEHILEERND